MPIPLIADRVVLAAALVLTAILFLSSAADPVNVVKLTAVIVCALLMVVLAALRVIRRRIVELPWSYTAAAALALLVALVIATVVSASPATSVLGTYGRNSGLLAYGSALVMFLLALRVLDQRGTVFLAVALMGAGLFTSVYGLFQYAGIDAIKWNNPFNPIIASMGNPDFASGYLGICVPVALWGALSERWSIRWRVSAGTVAGLCALTAVLSDAVQGPLAAGAGSAVVLVAWLLERPAGARRGGLIGLGVVAALGVLTVAVGALTHAGPAASFFAGASYDARRWYWGAALHMFRDHPLIGVGLDQFGSYWREVRSDEATRILGGANFSDAAHSVPLQMLAQGGLILGLTYLLFVVLIGSHLVRGLRRLTGEDRLLLAGLGGSWLAYQAQSAVSIDQVPLLTAGFLLAAAVVVASGGVRLRELRLPGALPVPAAGQPGKGRRKVAVQPRVRPVTPADMLLLGATVTAALFALWFAFVPLRADVAVRRGDEALAAGTGNPALDAYRKATDLMPGVSVYWLKLGNLLDSAHREGDALAALENAVQHDPRNVSALRSAGNVAAADRPADALRWLTRAAELDPTNPETLIDAADVQIAQGKGATAMRELERAVALLPGNAELIATLGDAQASVGDVAAARASYRRALDLQPDLKRGLAGMAKLDEG